MAGKKNRKQHTWFGMFSRWTSNAAGSPFAFIGSFAIIIIWALTGPVFGYSDTWQLVINTGTTVVTFLMVFLIQSTQNRDSKAVQLKLSELICAVSGAKNAMADIEELDEKDLVALQKHYAEMAEKTEHHLTQKKKHKAKAR